MIKQGFSCIGNRPPLEKPTSYAKMGIGSLYQRYKGVGPFNSSLVQTGYRLYYNANDGSGAIPEDENYYDTGDTAVTTGRGELFRTGYEWYTWNTAFDGTGTSYGADEFILFSDSDITLYAQWRETDILADLRFDSNGILYDAVGSAVGVQDGTPSYAFVYDKTIDNRPLYVSGYKWGLSDLTSTKGYGNGIELGSFGSLTEWSISLWMRANWSGIGGLLLQGTGGWHPRYSWGCTLDQIFGIACEVAQGWGWGELLLRANGSHAEALWNGSVIYSTDENTVKLEGGVYRIGSYSTDYVAGVDIARVAFYNTYRDAFDISALTDINLCYGSSAFSGMTAREETDGGNTSLVTMSGSSFDVAFPGTVCWGGMMGFYEVGDAITISGTVNYDTFVEGINHVSNTLQIVALCSGYDRSAEVACMYGVYDYDTDTITALRLYTTADGQDIPMSIEAGVDYDWSITKSGASVTFMWNGTSYIYTGVAENDNMFIIGPSLGVHLGSVETPWVAHYTNILSNIT